MAFEITSETQDTVTVGEKLWLTADREHVVKDGDPEAAFLLVPAGGSLLRSEAEQYGLVAAKGDDQAADDGVNLSRLKKAELIEHASKLDPPLELSDALSKPELIAAIEAHVPAESGSA